MGACGFPWGAVASRPVWTTAGQGQGRWSRGAPHRLPAGLVDAEGVGSPHRRRGSPETAPRRGHAGQQGPGRRRCCGRRGAGVPPPRLSSCGTRRPRRGSGRASRPPGRGHGRAAPPTPGRGAPWLLGGDRRRRGQRRCPARGWRPPPPPPQAGWRVAAAAAAALVRRTKRAGDAAVQGGADAPTAAPVAVVLACQHERTRGARRGRAPPAGRRGQAHRAGLAGGLVEAIGRRDKRVEGPGRAVRWGQRAEGAAHRSAACHQQVVHAVLR